jgi:hypothetical protein
MQRALIQCENWKKFLLFEDSSLVPCLKIISHNACSDVDNENINLLIYLDRHNTIYILASTNLAISSTLFLILYYDK